MNGLDLIRSPDTSAEAVADIVYLHCPPIGPASCEGVECRACWLSWLVTGSDENEARPSATQTAPQGECPLSGEGYELKKFNRFLAEINQYTCQFPARTYQSQ